MAPHVCIASIQGAEAGGHEFEASLGFVVKLSQGKEEERIEGLTSHGSREHTFVTPPTAQEEHQLVLVPFLL